MNEEFENKFRRLCCALHIDADSWHASRDCRPFAEELYKLGLKHGKS